MINNFSSQPEYSSWSSYGVQEYLIMINPNNIVNEKIIVEKKLFKNNFNSGISDVLHPHITIAAFLAKESMEEELIRLLQQVCNRHNRFTVSLNDFSGFPPHTIYIKVKNPKPFKDLKCSLKLIENYLKENECQHIYYSNKPHLTIARELLKVAYRKAIQAYGNSSFKELFIASELTLLKRDSPNSKCHTVGIFELLPASKSLFN